MDYISVPQSPATTATILKYNIFISLIQRYTVLYKGRGVDNGAAGAAAAAPIIWLVVVLQK